jgi:hypothetical protein
MAGCKFEPNTLQLIINLAFQLDLVLKGEGDTSTFVLNGEWHLLGNVFHQNQSSFFHL